ncbi:MAG: hypothetical protein KGI70_01020 [Patescibacteria group bacterium]|nr:hypothetical protein [Patescibacteria group bacterium]
MLCDLDKVQEHEAEQQRLVERIVDSLQRITEENYRIIFGLHAKRLLEALINQKALNPHVDLLLYTNVWKPIELFTSNKTERRYLLLKVFEGVFGSVSSGIVSDYHSEAMGLSRSEPPHAQPASATASNPPNPDLGLR